MCCVKLIHSPKESVYIISVSGRTTGRKLPRKPHVTEAHKENKNDGEFLNKQGLLWCYINLMFTNHR